MVFVRLSLMLFALVSATNELSTHHSFASEFDSNKPVTLTGTVTKVEWTNPHGRFFVEVKEPSGAAATWEVEQGSI